MAKNGRKTIGNDTMDQLDGNPLDILTKPIKNADKPAQEKKDNANKLNPKNAIAHVIKPASQEKERMTVQISKDTIERVKDCVYWNRLTVAQFVEEALEAALIVAEKQNGTPFTKRKSELRPGRPVK